MKTSFGGDSAKIVHFESKQWTRFLLNIFSIDCSVSKTAKQSQTCLKLSTFLNVASVWRTKLTLTKNQPTNGPVKYARQNNRLNKFDFLNLLKNLCRWLGLGVGIQKRTHNLKKNSRSKNSVYYLLWFVLAANSVGRSPIWGNKDLVWDWCLLCYVFT